MSHKMRVSSTEPTCRKFASRALDQDKAKNKFAGNPHERHSATPRPSVFNSNPRQKTKVSLCPFGNAAQRSISQPPINQLHNNVVQNDEKDITTKPRQRSISSCSATRESWAQMLASKKTCKNSSSFSSFDPLRTLHFLSRELQNKLQQILPENSDVQQMVFDMQHALKRIPPEVATLMQPQNDLKMKQSTPEQGQLAREVKSAAIVIEKSCQTPPSLYKADTELFHKIMEENTHRLEVSCKQLEFVCNNLQEEKEITDKELEDARQEIKDLKNTIKILETDLEELTNSKLRELEDEKERLQKELKKIMRDTQNSTTVSYLKKLVEELRIEKTNSDQNCARLEYDMTILNMEKEKFLTMLSLRDKEIKEIQDEMSRIQDQVAKELNRLNGDVVSRVTSLKALGDTNSSGILDDIKDNLIGIGDATISSIESVESRGNIIKESPCGDFQCALPKTPSGILERLTQIKAGAFIEQDQDEIIEKLRSFMAPTWKS